MTNSLRNEVFNELNKKCGHLKVWKPWIDYHDKYLSLFFILSVYVITYSISIYNTFPSWMVHIKITKEYAQTLNSSSNEILSAIVGITVVIIGFIFTEIKDKLFVSFDFFSRLTYLFPIFYSALLNIAAMLILSLLSETIEDEVSYNNAVIWSHYLIVINILCIILIFITLIKYMDYSAIFNSYKESLISKAKQILYKEKIIQLGNIHLSKIYTDQGIRQTFSGFNEIPILRGNNKKGFLFDIRTKNLKEELLRIKNQNGGNDLSFISYSLGTEISANATLLFSRTNDITIRELKIIKVKSKSPNFFLDDYQKMMNDCEQQFLNAVANNHSNQAYDYLSIYEELITLYCETDKAIR